MSQENRPKQRNKRKTQPSPQPYQKKQPIWKVVIIQFLRGTIGVLENTVVKLETEQFSPTQKNPHLLTRMLLEWDRFLRTFRLFLPSNISNNVSDTVLTIILALISVLIVGITAFVFISQSTEVAILTPVEEVSTPTRSLSILPKSEVTSIPKSEVTSIPKSEVTSIPKSEVTSIPKSEVTSIPKSEITSIPKSEITSIPKSEVTSIPKSEVTSIPKSEVTSIPKSEITSIPKSEITLNSEAEQKSEPIIKLTPEQALITAIENQLAEISIPLQPNSDENVVVNLIKSIQVNFRTSDLIIKISDDWYTLKPSQQQKLAAEILQHSQELDFTHLQLVDSQNKLIARSPVIGNEMIIFRPALKS